MPSITSGKVLVSGANGYVAVWLVRYLLEKGFSVRGTVRSARKGAYLLEYFKPYGEKLEIVVVEDITKEGAFDEAVNGVDAIAHTASPFFLNGTNPDEYIDPAVNGTVGILKSASKYGQSVKRVVVTSSMAAVFSLDGKKSEFNEKDWNEFAIREVKEKGVNAHPMHMYCASKALAEKAAWEYYESVKTEVGWDLTTVLPGYVYGPILHEVHDPSQLNESMNPMFKALVDPEQGGMSEEQLLSTDKSWVDVRDVAEAHILALTVDAAKEKRFLAVAGPACFQDFVNIAHKLRPSLPNRFAKSKIPPPMAQFDSSLTMSVLGLKFRTMEEVTQDMLDDFASKGWMSAA